MIYRQLSPEDEAEFRKWARENYTPDTPISGVWHPVVQEECARINREHASFVPDKRIAQPGSVSTGTMRDEDLIPCFVAALRDLGHESLELAYVAGLMECAPQRRLDIIEARATHPDADEYFGSEEAAADLEWLFDALDEHAPEGHTFGAHEGDGADYGFWPVEDEP